MNDIVVTLISVKPSELNRFLSKYYNKEMNIEEGAFRWSCIFNNTLDSLLILSTLMDNKDKFKINAYISINHGENIEITETTMNEINKRL